MTTEKNIETTSKVIPSKEKEDDNDNDNVKVNESQLMTPIENTDSNVSIPLSECLSDELNDLFIDDVDDDDDDDDDDRKQESSKSHCESHQDTTENTVENIATADNNDIGASNPDSSSAVTNSKQINQDDNVDDSASASASASSQTKSEGKTNTKARKFILPIKSKSKKSNNNVNEQLQQQEQPISVMEKVLVKDFIFSSYFDDSASVSSQQTSTTTTNNLNNFTNTKWIAESYLRDLIACGNVFLFEKGRHFWQNGQFVPRMLALYTDLIVIGRQPKDAAEIRTSLDYPPTATAAADQQEEQHDDEPDLFHGMTDNKLINSFLVAENVIDLNTCKLRRSKMTTSMLDSDNVSVASIASSQQQYIISNNHQPTL